MLIIFAIDPENSHGFSTVNCPGRPGVHRTASGGNCTTNLLILSSLSHQLLVIPACRDFLVGSCPLKLSKPGPILGDWPPLTGAGMIHGQLIARLAPSGPPPRSLPLFSYVQQCYGWFSSFRVQPVTQRTSTCILQTQGTRPTLHVESMKTANLADSAYCH